MLPHINFILPVSLLSPLSAYLETTNEPDALDTLIKAECSFVQETGLRSSSLRQDLQAAAADPEEQGFWRLEPEHLNLPSRCWEAKPSSSVFMHCHDGWLAGDSSKGRQKFEHTFHPTRLMTAKDLWQGGQSAYQQVAQSGIIAFLRKSHVLESLDQLEKLVGGQAKGAACHRQD